MSMIKRNDYFPASIFDGLLSRDLMNWGLNNNSSTNTTIPAVNIKETNEGFVVEMAAPGMTKDDFNIELDGDLLTISSEKNLAPEIRENERFTRKEFSYQSFSRSFQLSKAVVDADKIEARYENGVLHLMIPKKEEAKTKPPKQIRVA